MVRTTNAASPTSAGWRQALCVIFFTFAVMCELTRASQTTERPFLFTKLVLTDDDEVACDDEQFIRELGTIQIKLCRIKITGDSHKTVLGPDRKARILHEKSKKATVAVQTGCVFLLRLLAHASRAYRFRLAMVLSVKYSQAPACPSTGLTSSTSPSLRSSSGTSPEVSTFAGIVWPITNTCYQLSLRSRASSCVRSSSHLPALSPLRSSLLADFLAALIVPDPLAAPIAINSTQKINLKHPIVLDSDSEDEKPNDEIARLEAELARLKKKVKVEGDSGSGKIKREEGVKKEPGERKGPVEEVVIDN